ncbi:hypothetical protein B0H13DRAFT_2018229 [Mycena leptocephala]|nr:hypothetical protein B0H13DRAFT_2018229 [Mycena leptocephala]
MTILTATARVCPTEPESVLETSRRCPPSSTTLDFTLNPALITSGDYIRFAESGSDGSKLCQAFPSHSTGFFYYHKARDGAPLEGSLRFRVTTDSAPSSFPHGHDLLFRSGLPNPDPPSRPALTCRDLFARRRINPLHYLFRLTQEFRSNSTAAILSSTLLARRCSEYKAAFPRSLGNRPLRASTHQRYHGRRVVHLRIVKIVAPVTRAVPTLQIYDNYVPDKPTEGHLLTVRRDGKRPERWECDIDSNRPAALALRTLWDASRMSEG